MESWILSLNTFEAWKNKFTKMHKTEIGVIYVIIQLNVNFTTDPIKFYLYDTFHTLR